MEYDDDDDFSKHVTHEYHSRYISNGEHKLGQEMTAVKSEN
jgi:hypothetical protein